MPELQVEFSAVEPTPPIDAAIRRWVAKLAAACADVRRCTVAIGRAPFGVHRPKFTVHVAVLDGELARLHEHAATHANLYMALAEAFRATFKSVRAELGAS
jgi:hypothetical protein